jgi:hypothetical protein
MTWDDVWSLLFIAGAGFACMLFLVVFRDLVDRLSKWLQEDE